jgi:hypothetical protein
MAGMSSALSLPFPCHLPQRAAIESDKELIANGFRRKAGFECNFFPEFSLTAGKNR